MSECHVIWKIGRPDGERQWNFFVVIDGANVPIAVAASGGDQHLVAANRLRIWGFKNSLASRLVFDTVRHVSNGHFSGGILTCRATSWRRLWIRWSIAAAFSHMNERKPEALHTE
jgi:hypothetical protein